MKNVKIKNIVKIKMKNVKIKNIVKITMKNKNINENKIININKY